jgi:hypothetical protein
MATLNIDNKENKLMTLSEECKALLFYLVSAPVKRSKRMVGNQEIWS